MQDLTTKEDLHILMLEDEQLDVELNKDQLSLLDEYNCIYDVVKDKKSYLKALETTTPDIVLSDYNLPQYNGLEALKDLKQTNRIIPFIFVTGTLSEETAAETIKEGAWDYVVKDRLFRLPLAVRNVLKLREERLVTARAEEQVKRLLMAIDQTSSQIIVSSMEMKINYVNKKFTEFTGLNFDEVNGLNVFEIPGDYYSENERNEIKYKLLRGDIYRGEHMNSDKDGNMRWALLAIAPVHDDEGRKINYVIMKEDITYRKQMEHDLIEARDKAERSDKLKDAFLQNLSHEIRTPLNAVVGFSNLLSSTSGETDGVVKEYTAIIRDSSHQLLSIVSDILTIASIQTGQEKVNIKPFYFIRLLDQLYEMFLPMAKDKGLKLSVYTNDNDAPVSFLSDETKVNQILSNLLNNAIKFTKKGTIELAYHIHKNTIDFSVRDTGIGIPSEAQSVIFERFRQADDSTHTEYGGTGLGLSISMSFAQMLGGTIRLESAPGKGSKFTLSLPFLQSAEVPGVKQGAPVLPTENKYTILVAEDEMNNYLLIKALLNQPNIALLYAENGSEAVRLCRASSEINLVLMDIKMPVMDGVEAFKRIKEIRNNLPVIALTAYGLDKEKQQFLDLGFDQHISKPIRKDELFSSIKTLLTKKDS